MNSAPDSTKAFKMSRKSELNPESVVIQRAARLCLGSRGANRLETVSPTTTTLDGRVPTSWRAVPWHWSSPGDSHSARSPARSCESSIFRGLLPVPNELSAVPFPSFYSTSANQLPRSPPTSSCSQGALDRSRGKPLPRPEGADQRDAERLFACRACLTTRFAYCGACQSTVPSPSKSATPAGLRDSCPVSLMVRTAPSTARVVPFSSA